MRESVYRYCTLLSQLSDRLPPDPELPRTSTLLRPSLFPPVLLFSSRYPTATITSFSTCYNIFSLSRSLSHLSSPPAAEKSIMLPSLGVPRFLRSVKTGGSDDQQRHHYSLTRDSDDDTSREGLLEKDVRYVVEGKPSSLLRRYWKMTFAHVLLLILYLVGTYVLVVRTRDRCWKHGPNLIHCELSFSMPRFLILPLSLSLSLTHSEILIRGK